jgi:nucleoid DNA-binding protein
MASKNTKGFTAVAHHIHDLLDLPLDKGQPRIGMTIIQAIATTMTQALLSGDVVRIQGFGIFKPVPYTPNRTGNNFIAWTGQRSSIPRSPVPLEYTARTRVAFFPSEQIRAMLNNGTTWDEQRAITHWKD